jgi:hypothetical protein
MSRIVSVTVAALCLCGLAACGDKINPAGDYPKLDAALGGVDGGVGGEVGPVPSYAYDIVPLLRKSCLCHVTGGDPPLLDTYANVRSNASSSLQDILGDLMPLGASPLSSSEKALFRSWVNAGTPNN